MQTNFSDGIICKQGPMLAIFQNPDKQILISILTPSVALYWKSKLWNGCYFINNS